jgi:hypothetical protein
MSELLPITDLDTYLTTRSAWHTLAEHVVAKARWAATGKIGLRATVGGFGTPYFGDEQRALIVGDTVVREQYGDADAAPITTVRAAAAWLGVEAGAPTDVYTPTTALDLDAPLPVDRDAAAVLAGWFHFASRVLEEWRGEHSTDAPSRVQMWPEHFDLSVDLGNADAGTRANFGASPGDGAISEPYLYVGPWDIARMTAQDDPFWNQPWGAALTYRQLVAAPDAGKAARSFLAHGLMRLEG